MRSSECQNAPAGGLDDLPLGVFETLRYQAGDDAILVFCRKHLGSIVPQCYSVAAPSAENGSLVDDGQPAPPFPMGHVPQAWATRLRRR
jgi:hypothetical protein